MMMMTTMMMMMICQHLEQFVQADATEL